jgi:hypothetical protein
LCQTGERVGVDFAVVDHFFSNIGFMVERGRERCYVRDAAIIRSSAMNRSDAATIDVVDRRLRDSVSIFAKVILDVVFGLAHLVGPDGASILKMDDVGGRWKRRQKH